MCKNFKEKKKKKERKTGKAILALACNYITYIIID